MKFLLVEDNQELANAIASRMRLDGHVIDHAGNLEDARAFVETGEYDLILLDIMLPDGDGRSFLKAHRAGDLDTPVIVLTARSQVSDRIGSLDLGADDYVTKPFSVRVLLARLRALLRRRRGLVAEQVSERCQVGALRIDRVRREIHYGTDEITVTSTEFELLWALAREPGRVLRRIELMTQVYGENIVVADRTIDTFVKRLRHKLRRIDNQFDALQTVRGVGYRYRG